MSPYTPRSPLQAPPIVPTHPQKPSQPPLPFSPPPHTDSVRSFLRRRRWGRFDAEAERQREAEEERRRAEEAELTAAMSPGCRCVVSIPGQPRHRGTIAYVGTAPNGPG